MSRGLGLDFARPHARRPVLAWLLLAAGLAAAAWAARGYGEADRARMAARTRLEQLRRQAYPAARVRPDPAAEAGRSAREAALGQIEMPWGDFFSLLQSTRPHGIGLVALDADGRRGRFTLTAEAKDYPAMIDYYRELQGNADLARVTLTQHGMQQDGGIEAVRFVLRGQWGKLPEGAP
jgi:hypothetical protein